MYLHRHQVQRRLVLLPLLVLVIIVISGVVISQSFQRQEIYAFLGQMPVIGKWIDHKGGYLLSLQTQHAVSSLNDNVSLGSGVDISSFSKATTSQSLKTGAFKKEEVPTAGQPSSRVQIQLKGFVKDKQGNVQTVAQKKDIKLCKAGVLKAWVYLTVPDAPSKEYPKAAIRAPFSTPGFAFGTMPVVKGDKFYFISAPQRMSKLTEDMLHITQHPHNGKINKDALVQFFVDLFMNIHESIADKSKSGGYALFLNSSLAQVPIMGTDQLNRIARRPGELLGNAKDVDTIREAYTRIFKNLVYGNTKALQAQGVDVDSPEYKACRAFIDSPVSAFRFELTTTINVPYSNQIGTFTPAKGGGKLSGFLNPPTTCKGNNCRILLVYKGDSGRTFFNQLGVCISALSKYNSLTRYPGQHYNVKTEDCEGTLCNSLDSTNNKALKVIAMANVFDMSAGVPLNQAVFNNRSALKRILDPFNLITKKLELLQFIFGVNETGLYNVASIADGGYKQKNASIPIPVDCTCPKASSDDILNEILKGLPGPLKKAYTPGAKLVASALSSVGYGIQWNCSFKTGALVLSSTFDTPSTRSNPAVAYNTFTRLAQASITRPGSPLSLCSWQDIARGIGHYSGGEDSSNNETNKNNQCSPNVIKTEYDASYFGMPVLLHQKALFTVCSPDRSGRQAPVGMPGFMREHLCKRNYLPLSVYSYALGPLQLTRLSAMLQRRPTGNNQNGIKEIKNAYKVVSCMMALYNNLSPGYMQFTEDNGVVEAEFRSTAVQCLEIKPDDVKRAMAFFGITGDNIKVAGKFDNVAGLFKD